MNERTCGLQLLVAQNGVECHIDVGVITVGMLDQAGNVGHGILGCRTCAEGRAANVDGIGAVVDGFDADVGRLGRCEQFEGVAGAHSGG
ncbi:hypothetical protein SDC9_182635 [bioreactor metagenome]|uniref:Uncharacterized protein n=1 Tax=bioreactor metagenome TaxID=1076179 RepID=A0A645H8X2_9ZZZZ